jgi:hypothetical protein
VPLNKVLEGTGWNRPKKEKGKDSNTRLGRAVGRTTERSITAAAKCTCGSIIPRTGATEGKNAPLHGCQSVWLGCGAAIVRRRRQRLVAGRVLLVER